MQAKTTHAVCNGSWPKRCGTTTGVRDDLRDYVTTHLAPPVGDRLGAVLVVDETGDVKKGTKTVGVQRQYSGTAGRVENCQVAVYLTYATTTGYALIDHSLYLPKCWTSDTKRLNTAGVPETTVFATKPVLAEQMINRALDAGVAVSWITADEVYGNNHTLRTAIAGKGLGYVMAVAKTHTVTQKIGARKVIDLALRPDLTWHRICAGDGAHGPRLYDWAWIDIPTTSKTTTDTDETPVQGHEWVLIRKHPRTGDLAFYRAHAPEPVALKTLVTVAGFRWRIEDCFAGAKELAALDQHQVRTWTAWHRWSLLAMLAHAILAVLTAQQPTPPTGLARLTRHEIRRLLTALTTRSVVVEQVLAWSAWRRRSQERARLSHWKRALERNQNP